MDTSLSVDIDEQPLTPREEHLIKDVFRLYGSKGALELSRLTHAPNTPWQQSYESDSFGIQIPQDLIQDHYRQLAIRGNQAAHSAA